MASKNGINTINFVGDVINDTAAAKAATPYKEAGYTISTKLTDVGMTELTRTKKIK